MEAGSDTAQLLDIQKTRDGLRRLRGLVFGDWLSLLHEENVPAAPGLLCGGTSSDAADTDEAWFRCNINGEWPGSLAPLPEIEINDKGVDAGSVDAQCEFSIPQTVRAYIDAESNDESDRESNTSEKSDADSLARFIKRANENFQEMKATYRNIAGSDSSDSHPSEPDGGAY